jgi:hypothetical protein
MFQFEYTAKLSRLVISVENGTSYTTWYTDKELPVHVLADNPVTARAKAESLLPEPVGDNQSWSLVLDRIFEPTH